MVTVSPCVKRPEATRNVNVSVALRKPPCIPRCDTDEREKRTFGLEDAIEMWLSAAGSSVW